MRISSQQSQQIAINAMLEQQDKLSKVQQQVATGRRIFRPSEDPIAAAKVVNLRDLLNTTKQFQDNIEAARARLTLEEGVLDSTTSVIQRVRELAVMANNDTQTNENREFIAEEVKQLRDELLALANAADNSGDFLFAGAKNKFKPFVRTEANSFEYHGDDGQRFISIGPKRQIATSDSGTATFRTIKDGNGHFTVLDDAGNRGSAIADPGTVAGKYELGTYAIMFSKTVSADQTETITYKVIDDKGNSVIPAGTTYVEGAAIEFNGVRTAIEGEPEDGDFFVIRPSMNQDVFTTIQRFVDALYNKNATDDENNASLHNEVNRTLSGLDLALGNILSVRANVGARLNALDSQQDINQAYMLQVREILSDVEDLDYSEAVSDLNLKLTGLEASQKAFTRVQGISLFNHI